MKKIIALTLAVLFLLTAAVSCGEEVEAVKYRSLRVGTTTGFSGNFFLEALSNNISDMDVRNLIHGYSPVEWNDSEGCYIFDPQVVSGYQARDNADGSRTYTMALCQDLKYNDGTAITAADYAFAMLLEYSPVLKDAIGVNSNGEMIEGFAAYAGGTEKTLSGVRMIGKYQLTVTVSGEYSPYFYELGVLDVTPYPIHMVAPGCEIKDDGNGVYIDGPFTAALLKKTLTGENGYISCPTVSCGPYAFVSFDGETVLAKVNPYHKGNEKGNKPTIEQIEYRAVSPDDLIQELANGNLDLVVRCTRQDNIMGGMQMIGSGDFNMANYARVGLTFMSFCADNGIVDDVKTRQAISMCMDKQKLISGYVGGFGTPVNGFFGLGQWMYLMATGSVKPADNDTASWKDISMNGLTVYSLDVPKAKQLLAEAGWTLNGDGTAYDETAGGLRYRQTDNGLIPLRLKLVYPEGNRIGQLTETSFAAHLAEAGAELTTEAIPMSRILDVYYGQTERDCDLIFLGYNLGKVFDPSKHFTADGTDLYTKITDPELYRLTVDLRKTKPGDTHEYVQKWIKLQNYRTQIAAEIPLYSNAYFDFYTSALQDYNPSSSGAWTKAIPDARMSDYVTSESPLK